jgi:hypothetical protein
MMNDWQMGKDIDRRSNCFAKRLAYVLVGQTPASLLRAITGDIWE